MSIVADPEIVWSWKHVVIVPSQSYNEGIWLGGIPKEITQRNELDQRGQVLGMANFQRRDEKVENKEWVVDLQILDLLALYSTQFSSYSCSF